ncbi:MAG TPA: carboxypeptidase-like regulatory domain-containing protein, partial [Chthoniobacteraceae bacterium]
MSDAFINCGIRSSAAWVRRAALVIGGTVACVIASWTSIAPAAEPLTTLEYKIVGATLEASPAVLSVPKGVPGSIAVKLSEGFVPPAGSFIEGSLRGPSFPARRLVGQAGKPLLLPPLNLVGDYSLDGIRLVDASGNVILEGAPGTVAVKVFDEVLISRVTSRPLTLEEIQDKGIVIDEQNFRAVEFEVGFVLDGKTIPVKFPVVAPSFKQQTELIPAAELEERLRQAEEINNDLAGNVVLPKELETANLDIEIKGINFQAVDEDGGDVGLKIPPIPALMIIPGNIGFLNQFFSVMIFTENGAPQGSGLSVRGVSAELSLPLGPDRVAGTFTAPGDDPLRFARVGTSAVIQPVQPVRQLGPDGVLGTADDIERLQPGNTGQGEFLVEGLQEGLHVMDLKLNATLEGLAAGPVQIQGKAAGSVLVRNPKFSLAFAHPRTVRTGEPYEAFVTILNTGAAPANLVNVTLNRNSISGGVLESEETVQLGTILPGQTGTATFRIRAQRTGAITFSNLTTSDDSVVGRFRLKAGVDERGVALSPDTLVLPDFVDELPAELVLAANRVLGQALSIAKAGQTPAGVTRVSMSALKQKALELAEAGQRVRYGEPLARVLPDLLLDWQGARDFSAGWDQILRETNAGLEWREALTRALEDAETPTGLATTRLLEAARSFAGRGETWFLGAVSTGVFQSNGSQTRSENEFNLLKGGNQRVGLADSTVVQGLGYPGRAGAWLASATAGIFEWKFVQAESAPFQKSVVLVRSDGTATELLWRLTSISAGAILRYDATGTGGVLQIDDNGDGSLDRTLAAQRTDFTELPPSVLTVRQEPEVLVGRPAKPCPNPTTTNAAGEPIPINNYANVLAVLFNKPMTQAKANVPGAYKLNNGHGAAFVQVQPGGRVALITMEQPVGNLVRRTLTVSPEVLDARGNALASAPVPIQSRMVEGLVVRGRVLRADGSFAALVPVTLTYYDEVDSGLLGCLDWTRRSAQIFTDADGEFQFDFVLAGIPYSVSATDTSGLSLDVINAILESTASDSFNREKLLELASSPSVQNTLLADFAVGALPAAIARAEGLDRALVRDSVPAAGEGGSRLGTTAVYALRFRGRGTVSGQVLAADGVTPVANAAVNLFPAPDSRELGRGLLSDSNGRFAFYGVPLGTFSVEAASPAGQTRVISDVLLAAGETKEIPIVLSASVPVLTELQGRVTEPDGTAHQAAQVYVGRYSPTDGKFGSIVAVATSDEAGYWTAENVPVARYDIVALSSDGKRKGERRDVVAVADAVNTINVTLQARATVTGRVETSTGAAVANAVVGGGETLVRTDALGRFTLTGVPTGLRSISAALERNPAAGITFPRIGSESLNVSSGAENFVIVRLAPLGRIIGRVLDEAGAPVPNVDVAIPQTGGFKWTYTNAQGNYEFAGLGLSKYDLSAPAPPHDKGFDADAAQSALSSGSQEEVLAAIGEAFAAFTGVNNPLLNGEGDSFNPPQWGFTKDVQLSFDGQTVVADVRFLGTGTIAGTVKNGQGVPIGARVRLTGVGPSRTGAPTIVVRGERNSDPALGTFDFPGQALIGDWGLQAASPFFPTVISTSGRTTSAEPNDLDNLLQFPSVRETNGSLSGV